MTYKLVKKDNGEWDIMDDQFLHCTYNNLISAQIALKDLQRQDEINDYINDNICELEKNLMSMFNIDVDTAIEVIKDFIANNY
jgi:hypothetical protein